MHCYIFKFYTATISRRRKCDLVVPVGSLNCGLELERELGVDGVETIRSIKHHVSCPTLSPVIHAPVAFVT